MSHHVTITSIHRSIDAWTSSQSWVATCVLMKVSQLLPSGNFPAITSWVALWHPPTCNSLLPLTSLPATIGMRDATTGMQDATIGMQHATIVRIVSRGHNYLFSLIVAPDYQAICFCIMVSGSVLPGNSNSSPFKA